MRFLCENENIWLMNWLFPFQSCHVQCLFIALSCWTGRISLICLEGKSMTPCWGNTFFFWHRRTSRTTDANFDCASVENAKLSRWIIPLDFKCRTTLHDTEELNIWYHNVCIEIESLGYRFIFTLSALGDKDKSDFVRYIIGENRIWQLTPQE